MTPEDFVKKNSATILKHLSPDDRELIEAYLSMEVDSRLQRVDNTFFIMDNALTIAFAGAIIGVLFGFYLFITSIDHEDRGYKAGLATCEVAQNHYDELESNYKDVSYKFNKLKDSANSFCHVRMLTTEEEL